MSRSAKNIEYLWLQVKNAIDEAEFRQGLIPSEQATFDAILKRPREEKTAKDLAYAFLAVTPNLKEKYVADLSAEDEKRVYEYLSQSSKFNKLKTLFKRPKSQKVVVQRLTAPPGYEKVPTKGDGNCMFYSVYYAWNPEEGTAKAQTEESASALRQIISTEATPDDININALKRDVQESIGLARSPKEKTKLENYLSQINIFTSSQRSIAEQQVAILVEIYKQLILETVFWGGTRELDILNRFGRKNNKPFVWIFDERGQASFRVDPITGDYLPEAHPIHYNGINHYSILREIDTPAAAQQRANAEAIYAVEFAKSPEEIARDKISEKREQIRQSIMEFLLTKNFSFEQVKNLMLDIINVYSNPASANSVVKKARELLPSIGLKEADMAELETIIRTKIAELQGGKRATRKNRKGRKRHSRRNR